MPFLVSVTAPRWLQKGAYRAFPRFLLFAACAYVLQHTWNTDRDIGFSQRQTLIADTGPPSLTHKMASTIFLHGAHDQPCRAGPHGVELGRTVRPPCMRERRLQGRLRLPGHECGVAGLMRRGLLPACRAPSARAGCGWDAVPGSWQRPGRRPRPTGAALLHAQLTLCCQARRCGMRSEPAQG